MNTVGVIGATGRVGGIVMERLLERGAGVVAISRRQVDREGVDSRIADAMDPCALGRSLEGVDAVVVALGISENPVTVRLRGARGTTDDVRSRGTATTVAAMEGHGIDRLVVLSTYGIGDSAAGLSPSMRLVVAGLLGPQFRDHEKQEQIVRRAPLDWTIARPVNLVDGPRSAVYADTGMRTVSMKVGAEQVGGALADWALDGPYLRETVALSS